MIINYGPCNCKPLSMSTTGTTAPGAHKPQMKSLNIEWSTQGQRGSSGAMATQMCNYRPQYDTLLALTPAKLYLAKRSLLSPTYSAPFRCGMPRSPMESELICAESESVRVDWLVPIWQGHLCTELRLRVESEHFIRTLHRLGSD